MSISKKIATFISFHAFSLVHFFDPICPFTKLSQIQNYNSENSLRKMQLQFIALSIFYPICTVYGSIWLEYDAKGKVDISTLNQSQHYWLHQMSPKAIWPQIGVMSYIGGTACSLIYLAMAFKIKEISNVRIYEISPGILVDSNRICKLINNFIN